MSGRERDLRGASYERLGSSRPRRAAAGGSSHRHARPSSARSAGEQSRAARPHAHSAARPARASSQQASAPARGRSSASSGKRQAAPKAHRSQPVAAKAPARSHKASGQGAFSRAAQRGAQAAGGLLKRSRAARICLAVAAVLVVAGAFDLAMNAGRIYPGVRIGTVDVSGMTVPEASEAVQATYATRLDSHEALIFASDEVASSLDDLSHVYAAEELTEQLSFEEAQRNKQLWTATAISLGASLPSEALAREALDVGRAEGGALARLGAALAGAEVPVRAEYGGDQLESLANDIDLAIGEVRVDYGMEVSDGTARVTEGHDGDMVDRPTLARELDRILLESEDEVGSFVARTEYAPLRIDEAQAQATCDAVNHLITPGASFVYESSKLSVSTADLGSWVSSYIADLGEGGHRLDPYLDPAKAAPALVSLMNEAVRGSAVAVSFSKQGDQVTVEPHGEITIPQLDEAIAALDERMFAAYRDTGSYQAGVTYDPIDIKARSYSGTLSFDEALSYGVIGEVSSFTTQYTSTSSTKNRNHNIHLAADLLNDSIAKADGGEWSFNEVAGNYDANAGFLPAGVITNGEYETSDGGGVCQVATTVFNAVYDAGYPVTKRQAHSLHMESYPDGRDAAVSYPELDFVWRNDTDSDVLMRMSYTDTTVTCSLYGISPGYVVTTETGDWAEGDRYKVIYEEDPSLPEGTSKVKTAGTDGSYIQVKRIVYDRDGNFLRDALFTSNYLPINQVVIYGPGTDLDELKAKYESEEE